jgi:hypothetical protein
VYRAQSLADTEAKLSQRLDGEAERLGQVRDQPIYYFIIILVFV